MAEKQEEIKRQEAVTAIAEYSVTEASLAALRKRLDGAKYEVTTTAGMELARKDRRELVTLRTDLEKKRKEIKAPALEYCKKIDTEAARLTAEIKTLEEPIDEQIKAEEGRKEAIRAEKERIERERVAFIRERIAKLQNLPLMIVGMNSGDLELFIARVEAQQIGADFQEFENEAEQAKCEVLGKLKEAHLALIAQEEEAARIKAEQEAEAARLETLRVEQEKAAAAERERLTAEKAELDRLNAIEQEKIRKEREELARLRAAEEQRQKEADEKAAAERAEADRIAAEERARQQAIIDAERAKLQLKIEEQEREKRELKEAAEAEQARLEEEKRHAEYETRMNAATADHVTTLRSILAAAEDETLSAPAALMYVAELAKRGIAKAEEEKAVAA